MAAAGADHHRQLALVVEQIRHAGHVHIVVRADDTGDLLVEEHRELGRLHAGLGDVVGVVEADGQELPGVHGGQQANLLEPVALGWVVALADVAVLDDPVARPISCVKATELHELIPGISTGTCAGA